MFVLKCFGCGTINSACENELKRARNTKERSDFFFVIAKKVDYIYADGRMGV